MPDVNVRGRYRAFRYDGTTPLDFTTFSNYVSVIRRPNEISFVTLRQYIPGTTPPFTTFEPGSAYVIVSRNSDANFDMGPYTRVDRLPSSLNVKSPQYYLGLDKNSITIPLSVYALSVNTPLSSVTGITYVNGVGAGQSTVTVDQIRNGFQTSFTHFMPNSGYQLRNRVPYTFFAPLQSEMGDAYATARNDGGEYGMGYRYNNNSLPGDNIYGTWDKIVFNNAADECIDNNQTINASSIAALSSCGTTKALFVLGSNLYGQLGTSSTKQYYATWTRVPGQWLDVEMGTHHMLAINSAGHLYACGDNTNGQLGLGSGTASTNTLTLVDNTRLYVELAAYVTSTMVRDSNGFLHACGRNDTGQLGIGNTSSPIYSLTQETLGYVWTSVKANPARGYFVAISNKSLYGVGTYAADSYYFGVSANVPAVPYAFTREDLNLSDVQTVDVGRHGTFIRRQNQNNIFAVGYTQARLINYLAALSGDYKLPYFTRINVPSNASVIIPTNSINAFYYVQNNMLFRKTGGTAFTNTNINTFNIFAGMANSPTFILSARNDFRPTSTPTPTPQPTPTPSAVPYSDSGVEGFGLTDTTRSNSTYMYFTTATNYGFNLNSGGFASSVSINENQFFLPECSRTMNWLPNGGVFYVNGSGSSRPYNNRNFDRCVYGWGKNNRFYVIAYLTSSVYNTQSKFYLFKPHVSYNQGTAGNVTANRPIVGCLYTPGSDNDGVEIPVITRGYIEELYTTYNYTNQRAQIDFQFSPYTEKCGILYWRTTRQYPDTFPGPETIYLTYAESSTNSDLNNWTNGNTIDTDFFTSTLNFIYYNTYLMKKPKLYYDKTDSPTALYMKCSGTSKETLFYKNIITNETLSIATGHENMNQATDSELMLNLHQPDYQLIFNNNNKPVIFFNGWPVPYVAAASYTGNNILRCYFNGTNSNVLPLSVIRTQNESIDGVGNALVGNTFYDLYYESSTDTIFIAYMDNWIVGREKGLPRSIRVANYNYRTNTINFTETIYTIPANYNGSTSYAFNSYLVKGLKIFFDKRLQKIIVTYAIYSAQTTGAGTVAHAFYQRNGANTWVNISPNTNTVRLERGGFILKR